MAMKMNSPYFVALARTFEAHYGVTFSGIGDGPVTDPRVVRVQAADHVEVVVPTSCIVVVRRQPFLPEQQGIGDAIWNARRKRDRGVACARMAQ